MHSSFLHPEPVGHTDANFHIIHQEIRDYCLFVQETFSLGKVALWNNKLDEAIHAFSDIFCTIESSILSTCLLLRSYAYQRQMKYDYALEDAQKAIKYQPLDPDGYLVAGNLLLLQNDLTGALDIYSDGIHNTLDGNDGYEKLVKMRIQVSREVERRNAALMRMLPHEIMYRTLVKLSFPDLVRFASTCKYWRKTLFRWPGMWRELSLDSQMTSFAMRTLVMRAPAQYVRSVILDIEDRHLLDEICALIVQRKWNKIEYMDVSGCSRSYKLLLDLNADTLRSLRLCDSQRCDKMMSYCLNTCKKLIRFASVYTHPAETVDYLYLQPHSVQENGRLPLLQLIVASWINDMSLTRLIQQCPELTYFALYYIHPYMVPLKQVLQLMQSYCPRLQRLRIEKKGSNQHPQLEEMEPETELESEPQPHPLSGPTAKLLDEADDLTHVDGCPTSLTNATSGATTRSYSKRGLIELTVKDLDAFEEDVLEEILIMCQKNSATLEALFIGSNVPNMLYFRLTLSSVQFPRLKKLVLYANLAPQVLNDLINACPGLEELYLPQWTLTDNEIIGLNELKHLTKLGCPMDRVTHTGLHQLLAPQQDRTLHHLDVTLNTLPNLTDPSSFALTLDELLDKVLAAPTLHTVKITAKYWESLKDKKPSINENSSLKHLELVTDGPEETINKGWLLGLARLKCLEHLTVQVPSPDAWNENDMVDFVLSAPNHITVTRIAKNYSTLRCSLSEGSPRVWIVRNDGSNASQY
ncbi:hypothetical protein BX666DRAFT_2031992 [Dichotomocladium elegans]|nr:hypothetical protein BX666DRAFT_2031992 [Dichotomocladium elegans]